MSECHKFQELMQKDLDGEMSEIEAKILEKHLKSCPYCAEEYFAFNELKRTLQGIELITPPVELKKLVMEEIFEEAQHKVVKKVHYDKKASILVFLTLINILYYCYRIVSYINANSSLVEREAFYRITLHTFAEFAILGHHIGNALKLVFTSLVAVIPWNFVYFYFLLVIILTLGMMSFHTEKRR